MCERGDYGDTNDGLKSELRNEASNVTIANLQTPFRFEFTICLLCSIDAMSREARTLSMLRKHGKYARFNIWGSSILD